MLWFILELGGGFIHGLELFIEEFYKIPMEKINGKNTSGPKAIEKVHCHNCLVYEIHSRQFYYFT